jgi:hypothetical protein
MPRPFQLISIQEKEMNTLNDLFSTEDGNPSTLDEAGLIPTYILQAIERGQLDMDALIKKELARRGLDAAGHEVPPMGGHLYDGLELHLYSGELDFIERADDSLLVQSIARETDWQDFARKELAFRRQLERLRIKKRFERREVIQACRHLSS